MKYVVFGFVLVAVVPALAALSARSGRWRGYLIGALPLALLLVKQSSINFVSLENYRGPDRGFEITLADLIALALAGGLLARPRGRLIWLPPVGGLLALLFAIACLSALGAQDPLVASFSVFKWARAYFLYWVVVNAFRAPWPRRSLWAGLVAAALWLTLVALKEKYIDHVYRIPGTFDHSNTVPLFLNQFLPVLVVWGLVDKRLSGRQCALSLVAALGLCVASQSTFSRLGSALSVATFLGALVVANAMARTARVRLTTSLAVAALVVGAALALPSIQERIRTAPEESEAARHEFNLAADRMADDHPFGVGVNNFSRALTTQARYNQFVSVMEDEEQAGVCHHIYRLTAAELGKSGLVVFVAILACFAARSAHAAWKRRGTLSGALQAGLLLGALALHASGFAEWVFRITPVTYAFALCAAVSVGLAAGGEGDLA